MRLSKLNQKFEDDYDVMIVGGGPAGLATWLYLNYLSPEIASRTVLIEKEIYPREKLCGGALGGWTEEALKQLKIDMDIPSVYIHTLECRLGQNSCQIEEKNFFRIVRRCEFDYVLAQTARKQGLHLCENEIFLDMRRNKNCIYAKTNRGVYKLKTLIGADGALSAVRKKMNLPEKPILAPGMEIFHPADAQYDPEFENNKALLDFSPIKEGLEGYVWHFPCIVDEKPMMNHGIVDFRISSKRHKANLKEIFNRELKLRNIDCKPQFWNGHPIPWCKNETNISQHNILLVGDAAGIEPAIGGGIHLAFSYGEVAAMCIIEAFSKNSFSYNDYQLRMHSHILGKYIHKLTELSKIMYTDMNKTLDIALKIFSKK